MTRAKRILLVTTTLLLAVNASAGLWRSRKTQASAPETKSAPSAMSLTGIDADSSRVLLRVSGTPVYTSYSPSSRVFVIDLTGTTRPADLAIPATLPAPIASIAVEEAMEMGNKLTRVTFRLNQPVTPSASATDNAVSVTMPMMAAVTTHEPAPVTKTAEATVPESPHAEPVVEAPAPKVTEAVPAVEPLAAQKAKSVRRVATTGEGANLAVDITGDGAMDSYKAFFLDNPARLVVDIKGVKDRVAKSAMDVNNGAVKKVRVAQFAPDVTRIVVDLTGKTEYAVTPAADRLRITFGENAKAMASIVPAPAAAAVMVVPKTEEPVKVAAAMDIPSQVPTVAEEATWKMPANARPVINAPADQTPPPAPKKKPTTAMVGSSGTPSTTGGTTENVFDEAAQQSTTGVQVGGKTLSANQRVFTGDPISLSLKDADIKDVLRTFAQLTGLNIAIDPQVNGTVTVDFVDVPWDQALDLILRQNGLTFILEGNVMRVGTIDRLAQETAANRRLAEEERLNVPLTTLSFKLSYAKSQEVATLLKEISSPRARVIVDIRTNQLIVSEIPQYLQVMRNLIDTVDIPNRQVVIEARIVETTKSFSLQYGFSWGFNGVLDPALGTGTGLIFPNRVGFKGGPFSFTGGGANVLGVTLTDVLGTFDLDLALAASESNSLLKVISAPKVTTQDNTSAEIQSGVQIPYQTRINFTTTIQYIDATLRLSVTPQITEAGTIIMDISVQKTTPGASSGDAGPSLNTRSARTRVMVRDGGTAVIGGIYQASDVSSQN
ncbi:MAG: type IV pilus secretin PilQ, partial [Thermoanaerobaculia bacterium]